MRRDRATWFDRERAMTTTKPTTGRDRGQALGVGLDWLARWSLRLALIALGAVLIWYLIAQIWVIVLPVMLAVLLATVLWPPTAWLRRRGVPSLLAAILVVVGALALVIGVIVLAARPLIEGVVEIAADASDALDQIREWLAGPPLNLAEGQLDSALQSASAELQQRGADIATGVLTGVTAVATGLVTIVLALVLMFLFLKDGPRFLPWVRRVVGLRIGDHVAEVLHRMWLAVQQFFRTQAIVSLIDAVGIGIGLVIVGVPLALPLAVITFIGGFIPIVGAVVAGALAVLVALVSNGFTTALIVLGIVLAVQQIESNLLQPMLQGRNLNLHAGVVLLSVTAGANIFGITGAFLAVPIVAAVAAGLRYIGEIVDEEADAEPPHEDRSVAPEDEPDPELDDPDPHDPDPHDPDPDGPDVQADDGEHGGDGRAGGTDGASDGAVSDGRGDGGRAGGATARLPDTGSPRTD
jgi:predicted PurR-regulated permease PerM